MSARSGQANQQGTCCNVVWGPLLKPGVDQAMLALESCECRAAVVCAMYCSGLAIVSKCKSSASASKCYSR